MMPFFCSMMAVKSSTVALRLFLADFLRRFIFLIIEYI